MMIEYNGPFADAYQEAIGRYLQERCQEDQYLAQACKDCKKTLLDCLGYVKTEAKRKSHNGVAVISDEQVYEWVVHYILEGGNLEVTEPPKETKKEVRKTPVKEKEQKTAPAMKVVKPQESTDQLMLFDF